MVKRGKRKSSGKNGADRAPADDLRAMSIVSKELASIDTGDKRVNRRATEVLTTLFQSPGDSYPAATHLWSQTKAAYRFVDHDGVTPESILAAHRMPLIERCKGEREVLLIGDTTEFDFSKRHKTTGLGPSNCDFTKEIFAHVTLALTPKRVPLGIVDINFIIREAKSLGRKHRPERHTVPLEKRESEKWMRSLRQAKEMRVALGKNGPTLVTIFDRESDIHRMLEMAAAEREDYFLIIRAYRERKSPDLDPEIDIWTNLEASSAAHTVNVEVPLPKRHEKRTASLEIRYEHVTLRAPRVRAPEGKVGPVKIWAISATEINAPDGVEPIHWKLYTTIEVDDAKTAIECIKRYVARWSIEWTFRTTKTVCGAENRQFHTGERLMVSITLDFIVATLILYLGHLSREQSDAPCTVVFDEVDWHTLWRFRKKKIPKKTPSIAEVTLEIAKLGGWLARKHDPPPGPLVIARGLLKLAVIVEAWAAFDS